MLTTLPFIVYIISSMVLFGTVCYITGYLKGYDKKNK